MNRVGVRSRSNACSCRIDFATATSSRASSPGTASDVSVLQQHPQQRLHPLASRVRQLEQPQRMSGRRGVDDDRIIVGARVDQRETIPNSSSMPGGARFINSAARSAPVPGAPWPTARRDLRQRRLELGALAASARGASSSRTRQVRRTAPMMVGTSLAGAVEHVGQRVRRIDRQQQHALAPVRRAPSERGGGRDSRLADAALSAKEEQRGAAKRRQRLGRATASG